MVNKFGFFDKNWQQELFNIKVKTDFYEVMSSD